MSSSFLKKRQVCVSFPLSAGKYPNPAFRYFPMGGAVFVPDSNMNFDLCKEKQRSINLASGIMMMIAFITIKIV